MSKARFCLAALWVALFAVWPAHAQDQPFSVRQVNDHLYAFIGPDPTQQWVDGNSYAIIGDDGVFVVDAHGSPRVARANIEAIRKITDKPVTYLLVTHWHWDHNVGTYTYRQEFPDIHVIAHSKTREVLVRRCPTRVKRIRDGLFQTYIDEGTKLLQSGKNEDSTAMTDADRRRNERMIADVSAHLDDTAGLECDYPDITFDKELIVHLGDVEVQVRSDFRANTPGDAYVWLPRDSILITGDIVVSPIPYCFGSFFEEWIQTLDSFIAYHPKLVLPGHGEIMENTEYLKTLRDAFASLVTQARDGIAKGITTEEAMRNHVDLAKYRALLAGDDADKNWAFDNYFVQPAVKRVIKELRGELGADTTSN